MANAVRHNRRAGRVEEMMTTRRANNEESGAGRTRYQYLASETLTDLSDDIGLMILRERDRFVNY